MMHRQTAILGAMGWALVLPLWEANSPQGPGARWQHVSSFDSAKECEAVRAELIDAAHRPFGDPWMISDLGDTSQVEEKVAWADSRCLRRDDPRVGPPPTRSEEFQSSSREKR